MLQGLSDLAPLALILIVLEETQLEQTSQQQPQIFLLQPMDPLADLCKENPLDGI
jgi:hypothetical protein